MSLQHGLPARRRIYLIRHGDVHYFDATGRPVPPNDVPLNDDGRRQGERLAELLAAVHLDRAIVSDLPRATSTASLVLAGQKSPPPLEIEPALREVQPGRLAGLGLDAVRELLLGAVTGNLTRESRFLGGETLGDFCDRVESAFDRVLAERAWKRLLIVAHGAVNRVLLTRVLGCGLAGWGAVEQDPGCLNLIDLDDAGRGIVRLMNHTPTDDVKVNYLHTSMERIWLDLLSRQPGQS